MDRQDINRVARTIRSLMNEKRYEEVIRIAEKLNLGKVNNGLLILNIVEAYENMGEKTAAKNTLFSYYDVHGITGRNMMQKLIELCIETRDISNAVGLCIEFENAWPDDSISYLMRYQITASGDGSYDEQIYYLEKYKEYEFEERWGYELARLYEKNNQWEDCARICHELICFFGDGKYVEKAARLKERIAGLTDEEILILETAENRRKTMEEESAETNGSYYEPDTDSAQDKDPYTQQNSHVENLRNQMTEIQQNEFGDKEEWNGDQNGSDGFYLDSFYSDNSYIEASEPEDAFVYKTREAEADKIRQTEEAAKALRTRKENERIERERKIADVFSSNDRYAQLEKGRTREIHFREFSKPDVGEEQSAGKVSNKGILSSLGKVTEGFRKSLRADEEEVYDYSSEVEYITIGRDSKAYIEDIEERMLSELDMLNDEQIDSLTSSQIKEIYELKVLREVREKVAGMLSSSVYKYDKKMAAADMKTFIDTDPYHNPIEDWYEDDEENALSETEKAESDNGSESISEDVSDEPEKEDTSDSGEDLEEESVEPEKTEKKETETEGSEKTAETEDTKAETEAKDEEVKATEAEEKAETDEEAEVTESETEEKTETVEVTEAEKAETDEEAEVTEVEEKAETVEETEVTEAEEKTETDEEAEVTEAKEKAETDEEVEVTEAKEKAETDEEAEVTEAKEKAETDEETEVTEAEEKAETDEEAEVTEVEEKAETVEETEKLEKTEEPVHTILDDITDPEGPLPNEDFLKCVVSYAGIKGYTVEETAYMTIAVVAEEMQEKNVVLSLNNAKILTEQAILRAQKRSHLDKILDKYSKKRIHILRDRYFIWK